MASTQEELLDDFATLASDLAPTTQALTDSLDQATTDYSGLQIGGTDPPAQASTTP